MSRYLAYITYNGANYAGWQRQPNAMTIQEEIESAFSTFLRHDIAVTGCGRTDAGVHALNYALHFDSELPMESKNIKGVNALLSDSISINSMEIVNSNFHARFDCRQRDYIYYLHRDKDPFLTGRSYNFKQFHQVNGDLLHEAAELIAQYEDFFPFCKTNSDVEHYKCINFSNQWAWDHQIGKGSYRVSANRFLRGMVRLLVGTQLNIAMGKTSLDELKSALDNQSRLEKDWSVPAHGLFLEKMKY